MKIETIAPGTCIVRDTASRKGRTSAVAPGLTASRHLHYGRIILDANETPAVTFGTGGCETVLICLGGAATIVAGGQTYSLGKYDSLYVPRAAEVTVTPGPPGCDVAEIAAPVARTFIRAASPHR